MTTRFALDLSKNHFKQRHGDVTVIGTWLFGSNGEIRPCLVLVPSYKEGYERVTPCVVPLETAYLWSEDVFVCDPAHVARTSYAFAKALGLDASNQLTCIRVATLVRDHIGDLQRIPPRPEHDRVVTADAFITDRATGKTTHREISDVL